MYSGSWPASALLRAPVSSVTLRAADLARRAALESYPLFLRSAATPPDLLDSLSPLAAWRAAEQTIRRVPAYRRFLAPHGWHDDPDLPAAARLASLPVTDKATYIRAHSTEERCLDGRIPLRGTQIDESSGSTGIPYNWVRGAPELQDKHREMSQFARYTCGKIEITINAFSMGAWATGLNVGEALRMNGLVKSTGPDLDKIFHTLDFFGPRYRYVITAYPPFLKHLLDESERRGFDWNAYRIHGIVAGEGMSEGLRAYLARRFQSVWSGYGASDLDIGVAGELPLSIWIRQRAAADPALQRSLFGDDPRLPMLFQYNPYDYAIETNDQSELIITISRMAMLSPRIRYNIHDAGGVISFREMLAHLKAFGLDPLREVARPEQPIFQMPFLYLFGRSDSTISYMGANIYPEDVEQALFSDTEDARRLGAFCLELVDVGDVEQRPCVHVETLDGKTEDAELAGRLRERVVSRLMAANLDFRTAVSENASAAEIQVRLHYPGTGPFAGNHGRIKRRYIVGGVGAPPPPGAGEGGIGSMRKTV
ncbi:MAG: phenylacetate--CoA ligase family protein [Chloroflexota bacterium]